MPLPILNIEKNNVKHIPAVHVFHVPQAMNDVDVVFYRNLCEAFLYEKHVLFEKSCIEWVLGPCLFWKRGSA